MSTINPNNLHQTSPDAGTPGQAHHASSAARSHAGAMPVGPVERSLRLQKLRKRVDLLGRQVVRQVIKPHSLKMVKNATPRFDAPPADGPWQAIEPGQVWGGKNQWAWFDARFTIPAQWANQPERASELHVNIEPVYLVEQTYVTHPAGPEGQMFVDGRPVGSVDQQHRSMRILIKSDGPVNASGVFFAGRCECAHVLRSITMKQIHLPTQKLHLDLDLVLKVIALLDERDPQRMHLVNAVEAVIARINMTELIEAGVPASFDRDPQRLLLDTSLADAQKLFDEKRDELILQTDSPRVRCVGHAHIDLGWLWDTGHTRHKAARTIATQLRLLQQYDRWVFNQSSPQLYQWLEEDAPALFAQVKEMIRLGRWEAQGAMWVEADTNLPSGESLVRQLVHGRRYFRQKLGVEEDMLWLPDVFGYSAALPQLLRLAGVRSMVTSKISWNQYNRFPHDTFRWAGLDGSQVATHFITTPNDNWWLTYSALMTPDELQKNHQMYQQKELGIEPLLSFGYGDGGGGPTEAMLETAARLEQPIGGVNLPRVHHGHTATLMRDIIAMQHQLPLWRGELYLELHRGTYTSQAHLKRTGRLCERALHDLEWLASLAQLHRIEGASLNQPAHDSAWQKLLLTQFHDIITGSSVTEVYDEARSMHESILEYAKRESARMACLLMTEMETSSLGKPVVLFNTLPWDRSDPVQLPDGSWRDDLTIPAGGWLVVDAAESVKHEAADDVFQVDWPRVMTPFWEVAFDEQGQIVSLVDRQGAREVVAPDGVLNQWQLFEDRTLRHDAWDIDFDYAMHALPAPALQSSRVAEHTSQRLVIEQGWTLPCPQGDDRQSIIRQRMVFHAKRRRIDLEHHITWHDHHKLLKLAFEVDIHSPTATHEIQFGHIQRPTHRNTSWDRAQFETCAQRFIALQEHGCGVAILNDCKYGHDVLDNTMRVTCIKAAQAPDPAADLGEHHFTCAILPYEGTFQQAGIIRAAAQLNQPVIVTDATKQTGELASAHQGASSSSDAIVVDTLKPADDGQGIIVRLYESHGSHARSTITLAKDVTSVELCNLLEEPAEDGDAAHVNLKRTAAGVEVSLRPFQVVTLRVH